MKLENKQKISTIKMYKTIHNFCPLGSDWYTNNIEISVEPGKFIPDYLDIDAELNKLEGQSLIIEDVVNEISNILKEYQVLWGKVTSTVTDAVHLDVKVVKEFYCDEE